MPLNTEPLADDVPQHWARRLVEQALEGATEAETAALSQLVERVYDGLARSFGSYGAHAVMTRALGRVRTEHPALASVAASASTSPHLTGWPLASSDTVRLSMTAAVAALLVTLLASLTRLIGDDLAASLLEQSAVTAVVPHTETAVSPNVSET